MEKNKDGYELVVEYVTYEDIGQLQPTDKPVAKDIGIYREAEISKFEKKKSRKNRCCFQ